MTLEDRVMRGNVFHIQHLDFSGSELRVSFFGDPNESVIVRELTFFDIKEYKEDWFDRDDNCIEGLLGLHENPKGIGVEYMLHTDQRILWFYTEVIPQVVDMPSNNT
jgi:hypothetical protein